MTSLWWDTLEPRLLVPRPPLDGDRTADVVIVGAGFTGLWTAYYLRERSPDADIVVIDSEVAGFGASGRNGGWCSALFPTSLERLAEMSSRDDAIRLYRTMNDTVDVIGDVISQHGIDVDWHKGGTIVAARSAAQRERALADVADWRSWGFGTDDVRFLEADEARDIMNVTDCEGGMYTPHCAAIHPAKLVRELALIVEASGTAVFEHTRATSVEPGIVRTEHGDIRAQFVVRATEGYTATIPGYKRTLAPIYSLMIATEPLSDDAWARIGLVDRATFSDGRHLIIYGQRTADGRIAFGGRGAPYHFGSRIHPDQDRDDRVHNELAAVLVDLFPVLDGVSITHRWGGPLGIPRDWCASVGLDPISGMAWGGGYVGDGVGTSNLAGRTLADLITGERSDLTTLPWVNHRSPKWEVEPLRWLGTNGARVMVSSADDVELKRNRPSRRADLFNRLLSG